MPADKSLPEPVTRAARVLWDYMRLGQVLENCDVAIAMGSHDLRTAEYAAKLVLDGWAPLLVCSGATGRLTDSVWQQTEARLFAEAAARMGLDEGKILLEEHSTNTGENLVFSAALLKRNNLAHERVLLVHKPYMERRVRATAAKVWPQTSVVVTSPPIPLLEYPTKTVPLEEVIAIMAGDFQRVVEYPKRGFAIRQEIPDHVTQAFDLLVANGFISHLL